PPGNQAEQGPSPAEAVSQEGPDTIVDFLSQVLGSDLQQPGAQLSLQSEAELAVLAPAAVQAKVQATLAALEPALAGTVDIAVDVVTVAGNADPEWPARNVLAPAEADRLVANLVGTGGKRQSWIVHVAAGRTAEIDQTRLVPYLRDYDVEIAQSISITDPVVDDARTGTRILLRGVPTASGVALSVLFHDAEMLGGVRKHELNIQSITVSQEKGAAFVNGPPFI